MNQHLTIAYMTSRKDCKFEWFFWSLWKQMSQEDKDSHRIEIIVVDLWHEKREMPIEFNLGSSRGAIRFVSPKPNVWQGEHRLTSCDWFAASNARNTALCLAPDGYIAYVDDLSVLLPGWLDRVKAAMQGGYIVCGAYQKVKDLVVEEGEVKSFTDFPQGHDNRMQFAKSPLHPCGGEWLFGCSCAMPVEALLTIGGWTEFADSLSSEDYLTGLTLQNAGYKFFYDQKMITYESEELHHVEPAMKRRDKGISPDDKSHRALNIVQSGTKFFDNYYEGGMRTLRTKILASEPFPVINNPQHDWYDGQPVKEF
jgi:hypothetical protein